MITTSGLNIPGTQYGNGVTSLQALTLSPSNNVSSAGSATPPAKLSGAKPVYVFVFLIALFMLLKYLTEHEKSGMQPAHVKIGAHNFWVVGLTAMAFIVFAKVAINQINSSGPVASAFKSFVNAA